MSKARRLRAKPAIKRAIRNVVASAPGTLESALRYHQQGELPRAEKLYRKVLKREPEHVNANHLLGVLCHQTERNKLAIRLIAKAITARPDLAEAHNNLGLALRADGRLTEAAQSFKAARQARPDMVEAHINLAMTCNEPDRFDEAISACESALAINPYSADAHYSQGNAHRGLADPAAALACFQRATTLNPRFSRAFYNLGNTLADLEQLKEALDAYDKALAVDPGYADAFNARGNALRLLTRLGEAYQSIRRALTLDPAEARYQRAFYELLLIHELKITEFSPEIKATLVNLLSTPGLALLHLEETWLSFFRSDPAFARFNRLAQLPNYSEFSRQLDEITDLSPLDDPFFVHGLQRLKFADHQFERFMTLLRRQVLLDGPHVGLPFLVGLAAQCFFNEYVWAETDAERHAVDTLVERFHVQALDSTEILLLACYQPLHRLVGHDRLPSMLGDPLDPAVAELLRLQIDEPLLEDEIRADIPVLRSTTQDAVSDRVRAQYEENPYPRWKTLDWVPAVTVPEAMAALFPHLQHEELPDPLSPRIMIAGCGTGNHALLSSMRFKNSRTLAIDLSLTSLAYAVRKGRELDAQNVEFKQGDILSLDQLDELFDIIECVGVLHHMADPVAGWRLLSRRLKPGGFIKIGLYSEIARQHVVAARALIAESGYSSSMEDIRECRQEISRLPPDHPISPVTLCRDFYATSTCRDFLFHTQEHRFTIERISDILDQLGLEFLGFDAMRAVHKRSFIEMNPQKNALASLECWSAFERSNPNVFDGMYQFWARKVRADLR